MNFDIVGKLDYLFGTDMKNGGTFSEKWNGTENKTARTWWELFTGQESKSVRALKANVDKVPGLKADKDKLQTEANKVSGLESQNKALEGALEDAEQVNFNTIEIKDRQIKELTEKSKEQALKILSQDLEIRHLTTNLPAEIVQHKITIAALETRNENLTKDLKEAIQKIPNPIITRLGRRDSVKPTTKGSPDTTEKPELSSNNSFGIESVITNIRMKTRPGPDSAHEVDVSAMEEVD